jgi:hypothetical protein
MTFKSTNNGLSSLILFVFLLTGCFFDLNGQNCNIPSNVVSGNITPTTATFNWDAMPNATAYEVNYRPMNAPATQPWNTVSAPTNTATINALTPSTMYDVQVRSACGSDFSDYTVTTSFSTQNCIPPFSPIVSNITPNTANIQWTAVPGASGYQLLYRIAVSDGTPDPWTTVSSGNNTYTLTGLTANTLYAGRLVTDCGGFLSDHSKEFYFSTNPCSVPSNVMITAQTASSVSLAWDVVPSANQYNVQYRTAGNGSWTSVNTNTNSRTINGLTGNTAYEFRVRSNCGGGVTSAYTLISKGFTLPCAMPENAVISNVTVNSATVSWNNAIGANQYRVEYREALAPTWTTVNASATVKNITGLTPDTDYEVRVRTKCSGNQYSAYTDTLKLRTKPCSTPPDFMVSELGFTSLRFTWNPSPNATRYQIQYRSSEDTAWTTINTTDTFRLFNNLTPHRDYYFKIRSQCANNVFSAFSDEVVVALMDCITPSGFVVDTVDYTSAFFSWDSLPEATRFRLEYKVQNDTVWTVRFIQNHSFRLNNLNSDTTYLARLSAHCGGNNYSLVGDTLIFRTVRCGEPLYLAVDSVGYDRLTVFWDSIPGMRYRLEYRPDNDTVWQVINTQAHIRTIPNLASNTWYTVRLSHRCETGLYSGFSNELRLLTQTCYGPISLNKDTINPNRIRLYWSFIEGPRRFTVRYKKLSDTTWTQRNVNDTTLTLNIPVDSAYFFVVYQQCSNDVTASASLFQKVDRTDCGVNVGLSIRSRFTALCGEEALLTFNNYPLPEGIKIEFSMEGPMGDDATLVDVTDEVQQQLNTLAANNAPFPYTVILNIRSLNSDFDMNCPDDPREKSEYVYYVKVSLPGRVPPCYYYYVATCPCKFTNSTTCVYDEKSSFYYKIFPSFTNCGSTLRINYISNLDDLFIGAYLFYQGTSYYILDRFVNKEAVIQLNEPPFNLGISCPHNGPYNFDLIFEIGAIMCTNTVEYRCPNLRPTIVQSPTGPICAGGSKTLIARDPGAGGDAQYTWSPIPPNSVLSGNGMVMDVNLTQTTTFTVTVRDIQTGCTASATTTVTVLPTPAFTSTCNNRTICAGGQADFVYQWTGNGGFPVLNASQGAGARIFSLSLDKATVRVNPTISGTYLIRLTIGISPCFVTQVCTLIVTPRTPVIIDPPGDCVEAGTPFTLTARVSPPDPSHYPISIEWSTNFGGGTLVSPATTNSITIPGGISQNTTYTVTAINRFGCISTAEVHVTVCCNLTITPKPEKCYPTRIHVCVPKQGENVNYQWTIGSFSQSSKDNCFSLDVPLNELDADAPMITVVATAGSSGGGELFRCSKSLSGKVYKAGKYPVKETTSEALRNRFGAVIDPLTNPNLQGTWVFTQNFTVTAKFPITFRNVRMVFAPGCTLIVQKESELAVYNSYLHGALNGGQPQQWNGIEVGTTASPILAGQVFFDNVTLEHAKIGINAGKGTINGKRSGVIWVDNSCLNENETHLRVANNAGKWGLFSSQGDFVSSGTLTTRAYGTSLILRSSTLTCIDPLPGTPNLYTKVGIDLFNLLQDVEVGSDVRRRDNVTTYAHLFRKTKNINPSPPDRWLAKNLIERTAIGIQSKLNDLTLGPNPTVALNNGTSRILYVDNNTIANLIPRSDVNGGIAVGVDVLSNTSLTDQNNPDYQTLTGANDTRLLLAQAQIGLRYQTTGNYIVRRDNTTTGTPANIFTQNPSISAAPSIIPLSPYRMDFGVRITNNAGDLTVKNNLFDHITATHGTEVGGVYVRRPQGIWSRIINNRFQQIEYGTYVRENTSIATGNTTEITDNYFFEYKDGSVFFNNGNNINYPNIGWQHSGDPYLRGSITVKGNVYDDHVDLRFDPVSPTAKGPNLPNHFDAAIVVFGPLRPALPQPLIGDIYPPPPYNNLLRQPRVNIDSNYIYGNADMGIQFLGENGLDDFPGQVSQRIKIQNNVIDPNSIVRNYTGKYCKIGIHSAVCTYVDLINNTVNLGNANLNVNNGLNGSLGLYEPNGYWSSGFWLNQSHVYNMHCNRVQGGDKGFDVIGDNIPRVSFDNNLMQNLNNGLYIRSALGTIPGLFGQQGTVANPVFNGFQIANGTNQMTNQTMVNPNDPILSNGAQSQLFVSTIVNFDPNLNLFTFNPNRNGITNPIVPNTQAGAVPYNHTRLGCNPRDGINGSRFFGYQLSLQPLQDPDQYATEEKMAKGELDGGDLDLRYQHRQKLLTLLSETGNRMTEESTVLDSFWKANHTTTMAQLIGIERLLTLKPAQAQRFNDQIEPTCLQERNQKLYYNLYLAWARNGKLGEAEKAELIRLAEQCPHTGGKAVQQARMMRLHEYGHWWLDYPDNCLKKEVQPQRKPQTSNNALSLYPNPATTSVHVQYDLSEESAKVVFYNVMGVAVHQQEATGKKGTMEVETRNWASGIYTAKITGRNGENLGVSKLVIVK